MVALIGGGIAIMILLNRNKRDLWYGLRSTNSVEIYKTDKNGNIVYMTMSDGTQVPIIKETKVQEFTEVVKFRGNLSAKNNEGGTEVEGFGVDTSLYTAILTVSKGMLPIDETSLIWTSEPAVDTLGNVKKETADYKVVAKNTLRLNHDSYALQRTV